MERDPRLLSRDEFSWLHDDLKHMPEPQLFGRHVVLKLLSHIAALEERAAWRPIETAPKDGARLLLWSPLGVDIGYFADAEKDHPQEYGHDAGWFGQSGEMSPAYPSANVSAQFQPTHWQPLPEPPKDPET